MGRRKRVTRREFLRRSGAGAAGLGLTAAGCARMKGVLPTGRARRVPPSEKIVIGMIGVRGMGGGHLRTLVKTRDVTVAAIADVDERFRLKARETTEGKADAYNDYRRLLDRNDIDAVVIATPDHWHALTTIHACQSGKDVYVEKPLALTIEEGRAMVTAARRYRRIVQMGTQQRSQPHFKHACELVRNGRIGKVNLVRTWFGQNPRQEWIPDSDPPPGLDWDMWLGPAPWVPFNEKRHPYYFRYFRDYSGGRMTDWGVHLNDIAQWGMGMDHTGPRTVEATGTWYEDNMYEWPATMEVKYQYDDFELIWTQSNTVYEPGKGYGVKFYGEKGAVFVDRQGYKIDSDEEIDETIGSDDIQLYRTYYHGEVYHRHQRDWLNCIRTRKAPSARSRSGIAPQPCLIWGT